MLREAVLIASLLLAACSATGPVGIESVLAQAPAPPPADLGDLVPVDPGKLTVALSKTLYGEGETIGALVANGLEHVIYTEDSKSDCSIALLEQWEAGSWRPLRGCAVERLPGVVAIGPGRGRTLKIDPHSIHFGVKPGSLRPAFGAGQYRIRFTYRLQREPLTVEPLGTSSETFRVQP